MYSRTDLILQAWPAVLQLVRKLPAIYGNRMFITVLKQPIICLCSEPDQSSPRPTANSSMIYLILPSHLHPGLPSRSFTSWVPAKSLYIIPPTTRVSHAPPPSHPPRMSAKIAFAEVTTDEAPHMKFSPSPCYSPLLCPKTSLSSLFANIVQPRSSFNTRDHVSHPYKTASNVMLYPTDALCELQVQCYLVQILIVERNVSLQLKTTHFRKFWTVSTWISDC